MCKGGIFIVEVYKRVWKSVLSLCKKALRANGWQKRHDNFLIHRAGFLVKVIYSYTNDGAFTGAKRDETF